MDRIIKRIQVALASLDLGISREKFRNDFLGALNQALREVGGSQIESLEDEGALIRAALILEGEV
tara:strand:+ start:999 stop:1193 length:195 start_codon:yes stop_codon:yes gene_type:complete